MTTTPESLLTALDVLGLSARLDADGVLRVGPAWRLDPSTHAAIALHRDALVALLRQRQAPAQGELFPAAPTAARERR